MNFCAFFNRFGVDRNGFFIVLIPFYLAFSAVFAIFAGTYDKFSRRPAT